MSLYEDIREGKELWKKASWTTRGLIIVSVFLATSSVTSLADAVFEWKGFILQGVTFYREWFRDPIVEFLSYFRVTEPFSDMLIAMAAACSLVYRVACIKTDYDWLWSKKKYHAVAFFLAPLLVLAVLFVDNIGPRYTPVAVIILVLSYFGVILGAIPKARTHYFQLVALTIAIELVLAAINAGLTR